MALPRYGVLQALVEAANGEDTGSGLLSQAAATGHECADTSDNEEALAQAPSSATGHVFPSGAFLCES